MPGVRNVVADMLSRGRAEEVLADVAAAGLVSERLHPVADATVILLSHIALLEHRRVR